MFFFILFSVTVTGQDMEFGITGGGSYYLGDLNPGTPFTDIKPFFGVLARYDIDTRWAVKLALMKGAVAADASQGNPFIQTLGLSFTSNITDISAVAEFNFFPYFTGSERNWISPYIYAGVSVFLFKPMNNGISLVTVGTEGQKIGYNGRQPYSLVGFSIPFGIGAKVSLAKRLGMQVFWEMHKTFTDYLDDVSTTFVSGVEYSDPLGTHQTGMQRGDPNNMDWFSFFGVSLTYKFNLTGSKKCKDLNH